MTTNQELIERLRVDEPACEEHFTANLAADRIEELGKERDEARIAINQIGEAMGVLGIVQCLDDIVAEAKKRFAKLAKAEEERDGYLAERNKFQLYLQRTHADLELEVAAVEALNAKLTKALEERDEYKAAAEICGKAARAMLAELEKTE